MNETDESTEARFARLHDKLAEAQAATEDYRTRLKASNAAYTELSRSAHALTVERDELKDLVVKLSAAYFATTSGQSRG